MQPCLLGHGLATPAVDRGELKPQGLDASVEFLPIADAKLALSHGSARGVVALERLVKTPRLARPRCKDFFCLGVECQPQFTGFAQARGGSKERRAGLALDTQHFMRALAQGHGRKPEGADEDVAREALQEGRERVVAERLLLRIEQGVATPLATAEGELGAVSRADVRADPQIGSRMEKVEGGAVLEAEEEIGDR